MDRLWWYSWPSKLLLFGENIVFPVNPTKDADDTYTYSFAGWDNTTTVATKDLVFNARFDKEYKNYTVKFISEGNVLSEKNDYHYGDVINVPSNPTKESDSAYIYSFISWDKTPTVVDGNLEFVAQFETKKVVYTVKWLNDDETVVLLEQKVEYGDLPVYTGQPQKADDKQFTYTFKGWDKEIVEVTGEQVYVAVFEAIEKTFSIEFYDENDNLIETIIYKYGERITPPSYTSFEVNENKEFVGWVTEDGENIEDALNVKRLIKAIPTFSLNKSKIVVETTNPFTFNASSLISLDNKEYENFYYNTYRLTNNNSVSYEGENVIASIEKPNSDANVGYQVFAVKEDGSLEELNYTENGNNLEVTLKSLGNVMVRTNKVVISSLTNVIAGLSLSCAIVLLLIIVAGVDAYIKSRRIKKTKEGVNE